jgi:hypothetical protein
MNEVLVNTDAVEISVEGFSETLHKLNGVDAKVKAGLRAGFRDVGFHVQKIARRYAPYREGNLERSIDFQAADDSVRIFVPVNSPAGKYAALKHDGFYDRGTGTRAKGPQAGRKYIVRAIQDSKVKIVSLLKPRIDRL